MARSTARRERPGAAGTPSGALGGAAGARPVQKPPPRTLYGAVAGQHRSSRRKARSTANLFDATLAPEEVLFQSVGAPQRYAEKDVYFAHEDLPGDGADVLPDSDLLKGVHRYASCFYETLALQARQREGWTRDAARDGDGDGDRDFGGLVGARLVDEASMDETALLALGILLEEASRQVLGPCGDVVFTEAADEADDGGQEKGAAAARAHGGRPRKRRRRRAVDSETDGHSDW